MELPFIPHKYLLEVCSEVAQDDAVLFKDEFTAGELIVAMCEAASSVKPEYTRRPTFGPNEMPPVSKATKFRGQDVIKAASQVLLAVEATGCLPHSPIVGGKETGIGTYFVALAKALLGREEVSAPGEAFYPPAAEEIGAFVRNDVPPWPIHLTGVGFLAKGRKRNQTPSPLRGEGGSEGRKWLRTLTLALSLAGRGNLLLLF